MDYGGSHENGTIHLVPIANPQPAVGILRQVFMFKCQTFNIIKNLVGFQLVNWTNAESGQFVGYQTPVRFIAHDPNYYQPDIFIN